MKPVHPSAPAALHDPERAAALATFGPAHAYRGSNADRIVRLLARHFDVPLAGALFVLPDRLSHFARFGSNEHETPLSRFPEGTDLSVAVVERGASVVVENLLEHPVFACNPFVAGPPGVRFFAGVPLKTAEGHVVGVLYVMDLRPRGFSAGDAEFLEDMAALVIDELHLSRQALQIQQAHERTQEVLNATSSGFFVVDHAWNVTHMNRPAELLLQRRCEELLGRSLWEAFPEAAGTAFHVEYERALRDGTASAFTAYYPPLEAWFEVRVFPFDGGLSVYFDDVTVQHEAAAERERHREELRQKERAFRKLTEHSRDVIARYDRDLRVLYANPAIERFTGVSPGALIGKRAGEPGTASAPIPGWVDVLQRVVDTGEQCRVSFSYRTADGRPRHGEALIVPEHDAQGRVATLLTTVHDVTDFVLARRRLEASERRYQALAKATSSTIWRASPDGVSEMALLSIQRGKMPAQGVDARNWLSFVHPADRARMRAAWAAAVRTKTMLDIEVRTRLPDGRTGWYHVRTVPVLDEDGEVCEWIGAGDDITEQKQAEQRVRESEARFRSLVQNSSEVITLLDRDGTIRYVSNSSERITGHRPEDRVGRNGADLTHPDDLPAVLAALDEALQGGEDVRVEYRYRDARGAWMWVESQVTNLLDDPSVGALVLNSRDVTERVAARHRIEESEQKYRVLVEQSGHLVYDYDVETGVIVWSGNVAGITGHPPEVFAAVDIAGWAERLHPDDAPRARALLKKALHDGTPFEASYRFRHANGTYRHIEEKGVVLAAETGGLRMVGTMSDVTERVWNAEAVRTSERRYRSLSKLVRSFAYAYVVPEDGSAPTIEWITGSVEDVTGWPAATFDGLTWGAMVDPRDGPRVAARLQAVLAGEACTDDLRLIGRDGQVRWVQVDVQPDVDPGTGRVVRIRGAGRDVTVYKEAEAALIRAKEEAEEMARIKSAFLANMSHEIRTPLTAILGFADLLREEVGEAHREYIDVIEAGGRRLKETLTSVLELSQLQSGRLVLKTAEVDVVPLVAETVRLLEPTARARGLALRIAAEPAAFARCDRTAFERVLTNLVGNALKFTDAGTVTISVQTRDEHVEVAVADTGTGMSPEFLPHVFEDFRQESVGMDRTHEGNGLGLAISSRLVALMDGTIGVESEKGRGSTFTVRLPRGTPAPPLPAPAGTPPRAATGRALVVEDDPATRALLRGLLGGFHVCLAAGPAEVCDVVAGSPEPFDVVLLDINLGAGPSGEDLLPWLRRAPCCRTAHFVALTAYALPGDGERFLAAGFDAYVAKPFKRAELFAAIQAG